ncbi:MAG: hypothetical protein GX605_10180 [Chloroflexi bacterium]|nr:hypothetical protein [Chloroflexota bacterium]
MPQMPVDGLTLHYKAQDQATAELVRQACQRTVRLLREGWGLPAPADCRVYVMTSWLGFAFGAAPWPWKALLAATLPLWAIRMQQTWAVAGGWAQRFGRRRAVGVKPPRLLQAADRSLGERFFIPVESLEEKVQHVACHELTHAWTAHLTLPGWLREGLAMVTVDRLAGRPTVQQATLATLTQPSAGQGSQRPERLRLAHREGLVRLYVRGYWLTRYVEESQPGLLTALLAKPQPAQELEQQIAAAYGATLPAFWSTMDGRLLAHFGQRGEPA